MIYKELVPDLLLQDYIRCFWIYENNPDTHEQEILPDSYYELICQEQPNYSFEGCILPQILVVGQLSSAITVQTTLPIRQICIRFFPWGLAPFMDREALEGRTIVPAAEVMPADSLEQLETLLNVSNQDPSFLNEFLLSKLLNWQFDDEIIRAASRVLREEHGRVKIDELAKLCYTSQRHLSRKFAQITSDTPKLIASRMRFENVRSSLTLNHDVSLLELVHENSYTDQSHLIKEFQKFTGMSPTSYLAIVRRLMPKSDEAENVQFLQ